jgi:diaminopimelate decarboxylase
MNYFETDFICYKNNQLFVENVSVEKLVREFGTPLYVYSRNHFINQYKKFENSFKDVDSQIFFAVKSNFNLRVIDTFVKLGSGVDVNSEGELFRALKTNVSPNKIILTGVGKTKKEIRLGIEKKVLMIKAECEEEVELINKIASELNEIVSVAIRINPDVDSNSHPYISTGLSINKFGVNSDTALNIYRKRNQFANIRFTGIDMHIGSQITSIEPFIEAIKKMSELYFILRNEGLDLEHFDIGGGFGVNYNSEKSFSIGDFATKTIPLFKKLNCKILFEPGRFLTANGGVLITEVLYNKQNGYKKFVIVDAAMNDLLRPSIYQAYHHIQPIIKYENRKDVIADIVGPICESGDYFAKDREISEVCSGEYLAIMSAGAYAMTMASTYNARRKAPEILIDGDEIIVARSRETFEYMLWDENII